jgi:hypothetical protein
MERLVTAPMGSQKVGSSGMAFETNNHDDEAAAIVVVLRGRGHSTKWLSQRLGIPPGAVVAIARRERGVDAVVLAKLRALQPLWPPE